MRRYIFSAAFIALTTFASAQTTKSAFVHLKTGEIKEIPCASIDSITFGNHVEYDKVIEAKYTYNIYYGNGSYLLHFSDAPISSQGLPTEVGQTVVRVYALGEKPEDSSNPQLPDGTYVATDTGESGTLYIGDSYLCAMVCTGFVDGEPDGYMVPFASAQATVKRTGDNYFVNFTGDTGEKYEGADFQTLRAEYSGELKFENMDPQSYKKLDEDVTMVPTKLSGRYTVSQGYGNYSVALFNCPLDDEGYIVGAGELANFEILTSQVSPMDISNIAGEYSIAPIMEGPYEPGKVLSGTLYEMYGYYYPMGTYYTTYGEGGADTNMYAFVTGGKVNISTDGTNVTFDCDMETESGKRVKINFTAPASDISDFTQSTDSAPKAQQGVSSMKLRSAKAARLFGNAPALRLIKK